MIAIQGSAVGGTPAGASGVGANHEPKTSAHRERRATGDPPAEC